MPDISDALARLHAACFTTPRPWTATEIADLLANRFTFLETVGPEDHPEGFVMGRAIAGEAELLTIAVAPQARRRGHARALMAAFDAACAARAVETAFLEVMDTNAPALALYAASGWTQTARRSGYYRHPDGTRSDALILSRSPAPAN